MKRMKLKLSHSLPALIVLASITSAFVPQGLANNYTLTFKNTTGAPVTDIELLIFGDGTATQEFNVRQVNGPGNTNPGDDWTGSASAGPGGVPLLQFMEPALGGAADQIGNNASETFYVGMSGNAVNLSLSLAAWWTVNGDPVVGTIVTNGPGSYTLTTAAGAAITQTPIFGQAVSAPETPSTFLLLALSACGIIGLASKIVPRLRQGW